MPAVPSPLLIAARASQAEEADRPRLAEECKRPHNLPACSSGARRPASCSVTRARLPPCAPQERPSEPRCPAGEAPRIGEALLRAPLGWRRALPPWGKTDVGLMKGRPGGAGPAGETGAWRGEESSRRKPTGLPRARPAAKSRGGRRRGLGQGQAGNGWGRAPQAVGPEGPELKLNTRLWKDRPPFSSAPSLPLLFPLPPFS